MPDFSPPVGITFHTIENQPASSISRCLCRIVSLLHSHRFVGSLERYDDWLEHDGLHFKRGQMDVHQLFEVIGSARSLLEATPNDHEVCIGVAPADEEWYLRFRAEWDEEENFVVGRFDITLPPDLAELLRLDIAAVTECHLAEEPSMDFFARITV
jgi:hypothetical protein